MSARFDIQPIGRFHGQSAAIKRPKEVACFSYDDEHRFRLDDSSIRYYYPPRLGADLCQGFDTFVKLDDTADDHLDSLLKTIQAHEAEIGHRVDAQIVTWRGMMTKIMAVPFNDRDGFIEEDHVHKVQSQAQQMRQKTAPGRPSQDMMSFWGYKFETLCLLPQPWAETSREYIEARENEIVNNHAQYCSVVRTGIGSTTIVLGGEVDAVWDVKPSEPGAPINWVELKTSLEPRSERDVVTFERKLMKFWIQSFLLGVPKVIVGFRDFRGILTNILELDTASIPRQAASSGRNLWDGNICINFAAAFLEFLKNTITGDGVWRISKKENSPVIDVYGIEEAGHGDIVSREFVDWRTSLVDTR